jgi:hypothetical protein
MSTAITTKDTSAIESNLAQLMARSGELVVRDQHSFVEARNIQLDLDRYIKSVGFELDEGIAKAKETLDHLKNQKERFVAPARTAKESIRQRADAWAAEEKRKAAEEQERINAAARAEAARIAAEERKAAEAQAERERKQREKELEAQRKAGEISKRKAEELKKAAEAEAARQRALAAEQEKQAAVNVQEIRVAPSVPKVVGVKDQTYYFAEVTNEAQIFAEYDVAVTANDLARQAFLMRFLKVDDQAIGKFARETKDNVKAGALLPGVRFFSKG